MQNDQLKRTLRSARSMDITIVDAITTENTQANITSLMSTPESNRIILQNNFERARRKKQISKSCNNFSNYEKNSYTLETLVKKMTKKSEILNMEFKCEFLQIHNFSSNKTFDDSLKIHNERKSRYKHIYPCKKSFHLL